MATNCSAMYTNWVSFDSHENERGFKEEEEEEEEALSLCDLPINEEGSKPKQFKKDQETQEKLIEDDFDFGSFSGGSRVVPENQMCNADEVFFRGQILPLRHSVSSDRALSFGCNNETRNFTRSVSSSRSESMDYLHAGGHRSMISSRSSSIRSHNSSTSGSSTSTSTNNGPSIPPKGYKPRIRNQFHSHPSPTPQIRTPSFRRLSYSNPKSSSMWSFLQVGLLKPQEIGLADLKNRSKRFGSHNSNSSSTSSSMNSTKDLQNNNSNIEREANKKKNKRKQILFFGGCKCSVNAVESTLPSRIVVVNVEKTKSKKKNTTTTNAENNLEVGILSEDLGVSGKKEQGKQAASRHRTFEWLKQLSIQQSASPDEV